MKQENIQFETGHGVKKMNHNQKCNCFECEAIKSYPCDGFSCQRNRVKKMNHCVYTCTCKEIEEEESRAALEKIQIIMDDATLVEIETIKVIQERNKKGHQTYGHGLNHNDPEYDWLDMAIEEAADMLKYMIAEKLRRTDMENNRRG